MCEQAYDGENLEPYDWGVDGEPEGLPFQFDPECGWVIGNAPEPDREE